MAEEPPVDYEAEALRELRGGEVSRAQVWATLYLADVVERFVVGVMDNAESILVRPVGFDQEGPLEVVIVEDRG